MQIYGKKEYTSYSNDTGKHTLHEETEMVKCYVNLLLQII